MSNGNGNDVNRWTKWLKLAAYLLTVVAFVGSAVWKADSTYAKKEYVKEQFEVAQNQTVKTFEQVQKQFERFGVQQDIKFYQRELRDLNNQHITIERRLSSQPNNSVLKDERRRIIDNKKSMQNQLDRLMR